MKLKIPPPVYMLIFAALMWQLSLSLPLYCWPFNSQTIGIIIMLLGGVIDFSSLIGFIISKTSINPMKPENTQTIVSSGMYKFSRNPMYLGLLLLLTGWSLYLGTLAAVLLLPLFVLTLTIMQIEPEEKILEEKFGQQYLDYKNKVRRWL